MSTVKTVSVAIGVTALLTLAIGGGAFHAVESERGVDATTVADDRAYLSIATAEPVELEAEDESTLLTLTNRFTDDLDDVEIEILDDGGIGASVVEAPAELESGASAPVTIEADGAEAETVDVRVRVTAEGPDEGVELIREITVAYEPSCDITEDELEPGAHTIPASETVDCVDVTTDRNVFLVVNGAVEGDVSITVTGGSNAVVFVTAPGEIGGDVRLAARDRGSVLAVVSLGTIGGDVIIDPGPDPEEIAVGTHTDALPSAVERGVEPASANSSSIGSGDGAGIAGDAIVTADACPDVRTAGDVEITCGG